MKNKEDLSVIVQAFSKDNTRELNELVEQQGFITKNGLSLFNWNYIYRNIESATNNLDGIETFSMYLGPLWESLGIMKDGILYLFFMENRLKQILSKYDTNKYHHLLCLVRAKNEHLNGQESESLLPDLFNNLDDKQLSQEQVEKSKKILGSLYDQVREIQVFSYNKKSSVVKLNKINSFGEMISAEDVTEFDYSALEKEEQSKVQSATIPKLKKEFEESAKQRGKVFRDKQNEENKKISD